MSQRCADRDLDVAGTEVRRVAIRAHHAPEAQTKVELIPVQPPVVVLNRPWYRQEPMGDRHGPTVLAGKCGEDQAAETGTGSAMAPLVDVEISRSIAALPKADIHVHAESSARLEQVIAQRTGRRGTDWRAKAQELMRHLPPGMARLDTWSPDLPFPRSWVDEADDTQDYLEARIHRVLAEGAGDGALLVEVMFGARTILRADFLDRFAASVDAVRQRFPQFHAVPLVVAPSTEEWAASMLPRCLKAARHGLAGLNILPTPYDQPTDWAVVHGWAERARDAGLGIAAHAGEFGPMHLVEALEVPGLTRIGHALAAAADPYLLDRIADRGVTIECALTSNVVLGAVDSYEQHPIHRFVERGIPVAICTDDPVRACTTIGREYAIAAKLEVSSAQLLECTRAAIRASFCSPEERDRLLRIVE
jgi:adenosine deaminase